MTEMKLRPVNPASPKRRKKSSVNFFPPAGGQFPLDSD